MDLSKHSTIFKPEMMLGETVHIIGCGAVGSALAYSLVKLGVPHICLYDADTIEEHNIPNQMFSYADVGKNKATRLKEILDGILSYPETKIEAYPDFVTGDSEHVLQGYIFNLVDSMDARREIYEAYAKANFACTRYFETRMGLKVLRVYSVNNLSIKECAEYEKTLYTDEEVKELSACGTTQTAFPTANMTAQAAVWMFLSELETAKNTNPNVEYVRGSNELIMSLPDFSTMTVCWED
jgi:predicted ThiF/HesA family dinucleotide-utilizing enzyme